MGKSEGNRPLRKPRHRWEDAIKMNLQEVRWAMDWVGLAYVRWRALVSGANQHLGSIKCGKFLDWLRTI